MRYNGNWCCIYSNIKNKLNKMQTIKIPIKKTEQVKKFLIRNNLLDFNYKFSKDKKSMYLPTKNYQKTKQRFKFIQKSNKKLEKKSTQPTTLKQALKNKLTQNELKHLKTAHDTIGNIAILEIDKQLIKKQKLIAYTLLKINKNIKTVLKKSGEHTGIFRTQKLTYLAGKNTKEVTHKENNITLKFDVEKVYFSVRLATERKRITQQVKPGEDVLVMFSGCCPYPITISKNTKAKEITAIEINPIAHKYALENIKLNNIHNIIALKGNVKKIIPNIYHHIIGLKAADIKKELKQRLKLNPKLVELHLFETDLFSGIKRLKQTIEYLQKKHITVRLHMPFYYKMRLLSLHKQNIKDEIKVFTKLGNLCKKYHIKAIVHPYQRIKGTRTSKKTRDIIAKNLNKFKKYYNYFYFENSSKDIYSKTPDVLYVNKKAQIKNVCIDTCHLYETYRDNNKIEHHIKTMRKYFNTYFHLNDSDLIHHSLEIGKGKIDFNRILPYVNQGVTEVKSKDEAHPAEMLRSFVKVEHIHRKFDRILMPLPKSAEDFLHLALKSAEKNAIIHFYDFLNEKDIPKAAINKIKKACKKAKKKYKILNHNKCGQFSPHTYRICVDFKVY